MLSNRNIPRSEFRKLVKPWFDAIGAELGEVESMTVDSSGITLTVFRFDDKGRTFKPFRQGAASSVRDTYFLAVVPDSSAGPTAAIDYPPVKDQAVFE